MTIRVNNWLPQYLKSLFILSQTYTSTFQWPDPDGFYADRKQLSLSLKCFITTLVNLIPDVNVKNIEDEVLAHFLNYKVNNFIKKSFKRKLLSKWC